MFSEPVTGGRFFARDDVLDLLSKRASALKDGYRQNVALSGQSLSGKSSIILQFLNSIKSDGLIPVYVEVIKEPFKSFANKFIATLLYNALLRIGQEPSLELDRLLEISRTVFPKTHAAIKHVISLQDKGSLDEAYANLLALTSVVRSETYTPCVVILDEFDNLEHIGIKNPFIGFGKVIMVQKDTMYIVSSSRDTAIRKIISEKLSLLFGNFEIVKISNFDLKTSLKFIESKLSGFDIEDNLKLFLAIFTDGNAFYLDKIVTHARSISMDKMTSYIDDAIIAACILELLYNSGGAIHQYMMNYILDVLDTKSRDSFLKILIALASSRNRQQDISRSLKLRQGEVIKALSIMIELGIISKSGVFYRIEDTVLEFWLVHVYQRRKSLLIDGTFDKMALFTEEIIRHISSFGDELKKDPSARIAELFNLFSNELVSIDLKSMKLPHFTKVEIKTFPDSKPFISASFKGNLWIAQCYTAPVNENDIIDYLRNIKTLDRKIVNKIIVPLTGIDENAKLIAKELKMSIWWPDTINRLFGLYGKKRSVML